MSRSARGVKTERSGDRRSDSRSRSSTSLASVARSGRLTNVAARKTWSRTTATTLPIRWCWPAVVSVSSVASMSPMTATCHESDARSPPPCRRKSTGILGARVEALMRRLMVSVTCACSLRRRLTSDAEPVRRKSVPGSSGTLFQRRRCSRDHRKAIYR